MKFLLLFFMMLGSYTHAQKITVSDGIYSDRVDITWEKINGADFYTLERVYDAPFNTKLGKNIPVETNIILPQTKQTSYTDTTIPFGQYLYIITAYKTNISQISESKSELRKRENLIEEHGTNIAIPLQTNVIAIATMKDTGYRTVTDTEFFLEFQKAIDSSLPRIRTMKMLNFFGEKKDGWKGGRLVYKTTGVFAKPFRVTIEYKDFIDQSLKINGTYEVQIFKLFAQEGKLVGTFDVEGIYNGTVTHNLIIDGGQSVGGTYDVQQKGSKMVSLPWNVTTHPLDDSQYEENLKGSLKESEKK